MSDRARLMDRENGASPIVSKVITKERSTWFTKNKNALMRRLEENVA